MKKMRAARMAAPATPPTTPPTMAPVCEVVEDESWLEPIVGVEVETTVEVMMEV